MEVFRTQLLVRRLIPHTASIPTHFYPLGPVPATAVGPTTHLDGAIVDDDGFVNRGDNGGRNGHVLDGEP